VLAERYKFNMPVVSDGACADCCGIKLIVDVAQDEIRVSLAGTATSEVLNPMNEIPTTPTTHDVAIDDAAGVVDLSQVERTSLVVCALSLVHA